MSAKGHHVSRSNPNDKIYTPKPIAEIMIQMCDIKPSDTVLDPSKGGGVFYDMIPSIHKDYCEIDEGIDFFKNEKQYDVIVGNPPYSKWTKWLEHTVKKCNRFCYIFGACNLTPNRIKIAHDAGFGLTKMHTVKVAWFMSQSYICLFERDKPSIMTITAGTFNCEFCHTHCHRGIYGNDPNKCNYERKSNRKSKGTVDGYKSNSD